MKFQELEASSLSYRKPKEHISARIPIRLYKIIKDIQYIQGTENITDTIIYILKDWAENRYEEEKKRLLVYSVVRHEILKQKAKQQL